jgi:hypothetical protein
MPGSKILALILSFTLPSDPRSITAGISHLIDVSSA